MEEYKKVKVTFEFEDQEPITMEGNTLLISVAQVEDGKGNNPYTPIGSHCLVQGDYVALTRLLTHQASHLAQSYNDKVGTKQHDN